MPDFSFAHWQEWCAAYKLDVAGRVLLYLLIALLLSRAVASVLRRLPHLPATVQLLLRRIINAVIWMLCSLQALQELGINLMSALGAAGVIGVAVGFAAQTSLSNLISGLFLMGERSLRLGDYIHVGSTEGSVEAINLLSIRIRCPDNSVVRIPCEMLIKNPVTNESHGERRRCDIVVGVEYGTDLRRLESIAREVVEAEPYLLDEPPMLMRFREFGDSSINLTLCAYCRNKDYYDTRYRFARALYEAFNREGISFAFPTRTLIRAAAKEPSSRR